MNVKVLNFNGYNDLEKPLKTFICFFLLRCFRKMGGCIKNLSIAYKTLFTVVIPLSKP